MLNKKIEFKKNKLANDLKQAIFNLQQITKFENDMLTELQKVDASFSGIEVWEKTVVIWKSGETIMITHTKFEKIIDSENTVKEILNILKEREIYVK